MKNFILINNLHDLQEFHKKFKSKDFAFDTEFTELSWYHQKLIGMSLYDPKTGLDAAFIQFNFSSTYTEKIPDPKGGCKKLDVTRTFTKTDAIEFEDAKEYLLDIFNGAKVICASAKVEWKIFSKYGVDNWEIGDDVNLMSWMLDVNTDSDLKSNAKRELKIDMPSYVETVGQKVSNINWNNVNFYEYARYGARDAYATYLLRDVFVPRMEEYPLMLKCYRKIEIPLLYKVAKSEMLGVSIDIPYLQEMSKQIDIDIVKFREGIFDLVGCEFNIASTDQLGAVLFDRLKYPAGKSSEKTGKRSCDEDTLKELAFKGYEVADEILDYRKLNKLKNTYIDAIPLMVDPDGRLRCNLNQAGTVTNRFCVSEDTLIETDRGFIRVGDIAPKKEGSKKCKGYKALTHKGRYRYITHTIHKGYEEMYEVELENGSKIQCTLNHRFFTNKGWLSLKNILSLQSESTEITIYCRNYGDKNVEDKG